MKYLGVILLALVPLVWGAEFQKVATISDSQNSISMELTHIIESIRDRMPCGFPEHNIPPLAPFKKDDQKFAIENNNIQAYGELKNLSVFGLNEFDIVKFTLNPLFSRLNFEFNWYNVHLDTDYFISTSKTGQGGIKRSGLAKFALKNITLSGIIKYKMGIFSGKLSLRELSVGVALGEVKSEIGGLSSIGIINEKLNRIIEEWVMIAVNENSNKFSELLNSMLVPRINEILSGMTLSDILQIIGGINGEEEPCIPPKHFI